MTLTIGDRTAMKDVVQGGMGVGISLHRLAGSVAAEGGVGMISSAQIGFLDPDFAAHPREANLRAIETETRMARRIAQDGIIGMNIMVASRYYDQYVKASVLAGVDIIVSGAGLPIKLPEYVKEASTSGDVKEPAIAPIVSSARSAEVICKMWDRHYHRIPDLVVIEGPKAGGHLGFSREELKAYGVDSRAEEIQEPLNYEEEIHKIFAVLRPFEERYERHIPVVIAGGVYTGADAARCRALGADGVQVATRFVTTEECDGADAYKQAYIKAKEEDIVIIKSPVGMPGRAIKNRFLMEVEQAEQMGQRMPVPSCCQCLEHCDPRTIPYCITQALIAAAMGDVEQGLLFCGSNAFRAQRIETVREVMKELEAGAAV